MIQGGRLDHQGLAAGGAGADHQVMALAHQLQPHGLMEIQLAVVRRGFHSGPVRTGGQPCGSITVAGFLAGDGNVVERTLRWLRQFRRLRVRYERRADIHEAFLSLGCSIICFRRLTSLC